MNLADSFIEDNCVELFDHLTWSKLTKLPAFLAGRARRMLLGELFKGCALSDLFLEL
jgi:hypothetical protein